MIRCRVLSAGLVLLALLASPGRPATAQDEGRWVFSPTHPAGGPGRFFGWRAADFGGEYSGLLLVCGTADVPPGRVRVTMSLGATDRRGAVEMRLSDGARTATVAGEAAQGIDEVRFDAVLPGSHPLFGLLAETREDRTLSVTAPGSRGRDTLPLLGALPDYDAFARACGLQRPPGRG